MNTINVTVTSTPTLIFKAFKFSAAAFLWAAFAQVTLGNTYLDVRTPQEFSQGHVSDATHADVNAPDFEEKVKKLDKEEHYFVYCRSGKRASIAIEKMKGLGFKSMENLGSLEAAQKHFETHGSKKSP